MEPTARVMIIGSITIAGACLAILAAARLNSGRLPGDLMLERGSVRVMFPIVTSIILSIALTIILNIALRLWR